MHSSPQAPADQARTVQKFADIWERSSAPPDVFAFLEAHQTALSGEIAEVCAFDLSRRWRAGAGFAVEVYFERLNGIAWDTSSKLAVIVRDFKCQHELGLAPEIESYVSRFPDLAFLLRARLENEAAPVTANAGPAPVTVSAYAQGPRLANASVSSADA